MSKIQDIKNKFEIVGNHPSLINALEIAVKVAPTDITALILGESGVGKEAISKIIHSLSKRKHNNFIAINCGAIPAGTIDSELFGHEKGSFTSAVDSRKGYFETVDGGTIFLDEVGEMPLETQSRLLRVLESGEFIKVGSSKVQKTNVRVIAATNRDLLSYAREGKFREDLYYRLSTVTIKMPPLRDRATDIPMLFARFVSDISDKYSIPPIEITHEAMEQMQMFPWPGNIRQLRNFVEQICILEADRLLEADTVIKYLPDLPKDKYPKGSVLPAVLPQQTDFTNEREIMYQYLSDIKSQLNNIQTMLINLAGVNFQGFNANPIMPLHNPNKLLMTGNTEENSNINPQIIYAKSNRRQDDYVNNTDEDEFIQKPIGNVVSLQDHERELIKKSLTKHQGKRKLAAKELGISERTLYRKIKEYDLQ
ncbi:MAG: sigma-54 dependent transcriptional regulator [Bacteroidota bacterium]|nr:sigma-54 dependent transcriptional regulator [Bacteroidota bacterium]